MQVPEASKQAIKGLQNERLWRAFSEISSIPRESGNEGAIRDHVVAFAKQHGLECHVDAVGNVVLKAKASAGLEHLPSVALQGHLDMVCVKDPGVVHDFTQDPLILRRDGDLMRASGTSLGADNGIAVAMIMDLFTDPTAMHGPLEAILTISEETGLQGAFGLDATLVDSRLMINLDSEEEGVFYIGCAGGGGVEGSLNLELEPVPDRFTAWRLLADGMASGHSGAEIDKQRANAIACIVRVLHAAAKEFDLMLVSIDGGTKRNVIPNRCEACFMIPTDRQQDFVAIKDRIANELHVEFAQSDPALRLIAELADTDFSEAISIGQTAKILRALTLTPHGVDRMSMTIPDLVETSSNLAIVRRSGSTMEFITSHRSSIQSALNHVAQKTVAAFTTMGATYTLRDSYPAWTPDPASKLACICKQTWEEYTGQPAKVTAIHAGLECGIINSLLPGMDSVSLGPDLRGVHSTAEACSISSTQRVAAFLRHLLVSLR
jgi:dipeptidase D